MTRPLPDAVRVIERGWLSSNNILLFDGDEATLVDSGYVGHAAQTLDLVKSALIKPLRSRAVEQKTLSSPLRMVTRRFRTDWILAALMSPPESS